MAMITIFSYFEFDDELCSIDIGSWRKGLYLRILIKIHHDITWGNHI